MDDWRRQFQKSGSVTCVLNAASEIIYCNPAWDEFALRNDGEKATARHVLGHSIRDYIPPVLESHYQKLFSSALVERNIAAAEYECNSPDLFRSYRMLLLPIPKSELVAIVHSLRCEHPISPEPREANTYTSRGPAVVMCAQCRRTQGDNSEWVWIPEFLKSPPLSVIPGICQDCVMYVVA